MRAVRQTFEHLVIICGVIVLVLVIIFSIPGVRPWVLENGTAAVIKVAGSGATSSLMVGVNPKLLATAVNDEETREDLIDLWKKSIPEMEPDALADMANQLMADPNTAAFITNVIAETDSEKMAELYNSLIGDPAMADYWTAVYAKMDMAGMANLTNALMANEATAKLVNNLIEYADNEATARLLNSLLADEETANKSIELLNALDAEAVGTFVNGVMAEATVGDSKLVDFINTLIENSDTQKVAALAEKIMSNDAALALVGNVMGAINGKSCGYFTFELLANEGTSRFLNGAMGQISPDHQAYALDVMSRLLQPYTEANGGFDWQSIKGLYQDPTFNWDAVKDKFDWSHGSGIYDLMMGNRFENDSILDYFWIECEVDKVFCGGLPVSEYMGQRGAIETRAAIKMNADLLLQQPTFASWWNTWFPMYPADTINSCMIADIIGALITDDLAKRVGELIGLTVDGMFEGASYYVRVRDTNIGITPYWDMPYWSSTAAVVEPWGLVDYVPPSEDRGVTIYGPEDYLFKRDANGNAILAPQYVHMAG